MKNRLPIFSLLLFAAVFLFLSCHTEQSSDQDPYQHIQNVEVQTLLKKAIEAAGGLHNWKNIKKLNFKKDFKLLDSTGTVERSALQLHNYVFDPQEHIKISWRDSLNHSIVSLNGNVSKIVNGKVDTLANATSLKNTVAAATFVISIPFKLLDGGVQMTYQGLDTLANGKVVHVLKAIYDTELHENHSTPDTWWHYFDQETYRQLGYLVFHVDHFSYVENLSFEEVNGFVLPKERKSYRADSLRNIKYLRAAYVYSDYTLH